MVGMEIGMGSPFGQLDNSKSNTAGGSKVVTVHTWHSLIEIQARKGEGNIKHSVPLKREQRTTTQPTVSSKMCFVCVACGQLEENYFG